MPNQHRHPGLTVRPPKMVQNSAKKILAEHGWTMQDFITACLTAVNHDPEAVLAQFVGHRPKPDRKSKRILDEGGLE